MAAQKTKKQKEPEKKIFTDSNFPVKRIYQKSSKKRTNEDSGKFPFTRGIHPGMYRDRFWTMDNILDLVMQTSQMRDSNSCLKRVRLASVWLLISNSNWI